MGVWGLVLTLSRKNKIGAAIKNAIETNDPQSINDLVGIDHSMYFKNYSKKHSYNPTFVFKAIAVLEPASIEDIDFYKTEKGLMAIHNNKTGEIAAVAPFMDVMELSSIGSDTKRTELPLITDKVALSHRLDKNKRSKKVEEFMKSSLKHRKRST
jgi:hypothetical protein